MHRGRSSLLALLATTAAGAALPPVASADQKPGQSKTAYVQSGDYAKDVAAAAAPATAWIRERSDQLIELTAACKAYGLPVGGDGVATSPTVAQPTAAQVAQAASTKKAAARAAKRAKAAKAASSRLARKAGASAAARRKARAKARTLDRRSKAAARKARAAAAAATTSVAVPDAADCRGLIRPAVVFDIDETLLSNYIGVPNSDPETGSAGQFPGALSGTGTRMPGVGEAFDAAKKRGMAVFLITARPSLVPGLQETTIRNLGAAGYSGWAGLSLKADATEASAKYKTATRAAIEAEGYTIIANVGDQESDLVGGHSERRFKLPNPFYTG
ncbi:HAD family acid phosphatase [Patulibacter minatonensis]|uniref:HAD family acid phosphatase n=1 Tax=Patulibacter minatonensis TaxID=298163 RepID=UPI000684C4AB|nr:HAD family acid phosphatase [Patulibacter minatonensis]